MSQIQIITTQNVALNFTLANEGERILAFIIDMIIKVAYVTVVYQLGFNLLNFRDIFNNMDNWSILSIFLLFYFPIMFYSLALEVFFEGQTIGKKLVKIKVVKIDGYQAHFFDYLIRWLFRIVDINIPPFPPGIIGLITILFNKNKQRFGGMTSGTAVISLKSSINISHTILEDLKLDYLPTYSSVIKLSDNDARIIKEHFTAAKKAKDYKTITRLKNKVEEVMESKSVHKDDISFLDTVMKDYNFYTRDM